MKTFRIVLFLLLAAVSTQAQTNYYTGIDGLYGQQLKNRLHTIIRGHKKYSYTSSSTDTWDILKLSDRDTNDASKVTLIYSGWSRDAAAEYAGGSGWTREHIWPKSHGFPSSGDTAYTDTHHLRPCDQSINSSRSNKDYDNGGSQVIDGDGATACLTDSDSWEPRDEVKGDCARMIFYMTTRYESSSLDLEIMDYTGTPSDQPLLGKLSTLLEWNRMDPPDDFERNRNEVIYGFQNNRNPFIDHPEFVDRIYCDDDLVLEKSEVVSSTQIVLTFNSELEINAAQNVTNYNINRGVGTPSSAIKGYLGDLNKVVLIVGALSLNQKYIVHVSNLSSTSGNNIAANSISAINIESVFPVELTSFTAAQKNNLVLLQWQTATEVNNYGFEIERASFSTTPVSLSSNNNPGSLNPDEKGVTLSPVEGWKKIGFVNGNGNSNSPKHYSFSDSDISQSSIYKYRLKQLDIDGTFEYSDEVEVNFVTASEFRLNQNYPNPFNPSTEITFTLPQAGFVELNVYNSLGEVVRKIFSENMNSGFHTFSFNANGLSAGVYFYKLSNGEFNVVKKMILMK